MAELAPFSVDDAFLDEYAKLQRADEAEIRRALTQRAALLAVKAARLSRTGAFASDDAEGEEGDGVAAASKLLPLRARFGLSGSGSGDAEESKDDAPAADYLAWRRALMGARYHRAWREAEEDAAKLAAAEAMSRALEAERAEREQFYDPDAVRASEERPMSEYRLGLKHVFHQKRVTALRFAFHDSELFAAAVGTGDIVICSTATKSVLATLEGHRKPVRAVDWDSSGGYLLSVSDDHSLRIWSVNVTDWTVGAADDAAVECRCVRIEYGDLPLSCAAFCPLNNNLCVVGVHTARGMLRVFNVSTGRVVQTIRIGRPVTALTFDSSGKLLFVGDSGGNVRRLVFTEDAMVQRETPFIGAAVTVIDDAAVAAAEAVRLMDAPLPAAGSPRRRFDDSDSRRHRIMSLAYKDFERRHKRPALLVVTAQRCCQLWVAPADCGDAEAVASATAARARRRRDGGSALSGGSSTHDLLAESSWKLKEELPHSPSAAWAACSSLIIRGGTDRRLHVLDPDGDLTRAVTVLSGHVGRVCAMTWSFDDRYLVSGDENGDVIVWDSAKKEAAPPPPPPRGSAADGKAAERSKSACPVCGEVMLDSLLLAHVEICLVESGKKNLALGRKKIASSSSSGKRRSSTRRWSLFRR
eukprot:PLAT9739.1.p1 GENE.PLAT9739.1~~PLAT9739.1.p1  ORF type:complete len:641 (+),score=256.99 PLAT9739.1:11-1933(+)